MAVSMRVETGELKKSANIIEDKTARYTAEWTKIYTEIASLNVDWKGQSSEMFNKQIEGYRNDFQELGNILKSYTEYLKITADTIEKNEQTLQEAANGLFTGR